MIYRFDEFELDDDRYELSARGEPRALARKSFDVLLHMLQRAGTVLSPRELHDALWRDESITENAVAVHVYAIRRALGAERAARVLSTIRGKGYSIACPVERCWIGQRAQASTAQRPLLRFAGRERLMQQILGMLREIGSGEDRGCVIHGHPGSGKTRMLDELADALRRERRIVLRARGDRDAPSASLRSLAQLLESAQTALREDAPSGAATSTGLDPYSARAELDAFARALERDPPGSEHARVRRIRAAARLLAALARTTPLVLLVDDLQWIDESFITALTSGFRASGDRALWVATVRDGLPIQPVVHDGPDPFALEVGMRQFALPGLDRAASEQLIVESLGAELPREVVSNLSELSDGNPFILSEILAAIHLRSAAGEEHAWNASGLDLAQIPLSDSLRDLSAERLRSLSADCRSLLRWAAVLGRSFSSVLLGALTGLSSQELLTLLAEACDAAVIGREPADCPGSALPIGHYGFTLGILRAAIYAGTPLAERQSMHLAAVESLWRLHEDAGPVSADALDEIASHLFHGAADTDPDRVTAHCVRAARGALCAGEYERAVGHLRRAQRVESLRASPSPLRQCCVQIALGHALLRADRKDAGRSALLEAVHLARGLERPDMLALCAIELGEWPLFRRALFGPEPESVREMLALMDAVLETPSTVPLSLRSRLESIRIGVLTVRGHDRTDSVALADANLARAQSSGDERAVFQALLAKRACLPRPEQIPEAAALAGRLREIALRLKEPELLFAALEAAVTPAIAAGDMETADRSIEEAAALAPRLRSPLHDHIVLRFRFARRIGSGDVDGARPLLEHLIALARSLGHAKILWAYNATQVWVRSFEGHPSVPRQIENLSQAEAPSPLIGAIMTAHYHFAMGDRKTSAQWFARAARRDFADLAVDDDWLWNLGVCADMCCRLRDRRRAEQLYAMLRPYADVNLTSSLYTYRGCAHHNLGRLARLQGRIDIAIAHFEAAIVSNRQIDAPLSVLMSLYHCGRALLQGSKSQRVRGRELLCEVSARAERSHVGSLLQRSEWSHLR